MKNRFNWDAVREAYNLIKDSPEAKLKIFLKKRGDKVFQGSILVKDMFEFLYKLSEKEVVEVLTIKNEDGGVIFRYKKGSTKSEEVAPRSDRCAILASWEAFSPEKKSIIIDMLISQIK